MASTILVGHVFTSPTGKGPIVVAAYTMIQGKREVAHYTVLNDSGEYELMVGQGDYHDIANWDKNRNLIYDAGEPAGGVVLDIDFVIPEKGRKIDLPLGFEISSVKPAILHSRLAGAITDLDYEYFAE